MIVLDTHVLVWWVTANPALSTQARAAIEYEQTNRGEIIVSTISAWEIALLVQREKLVLSMDVSEWLATVAAIESVRFVAVDVETATKSVVLPGAFHKDPADRMIVAMARILAVPLITADQKIRDYVHVKTIW